MSNVTAPELVAEIYRLSDAGHSPVEVARRTGVAPETVKKRIQRERRRRLTEQGLVPPVLKDPSILTGKTLEAMLVLHAAGWSNTHISEGLGCTVNAIRICLFRRGLRSNTDHAA